MQNHHMKSHLVLDVGGVLLHNLTAFWEGAAQLIGLSYEDLRVKYKSELRETLWTDEITEEGFWDWVCSLSSELPREQARHMMISCMKPLPALERLEYWSQSMELHVLSNHRAEWIRPILEPYAKYFTTMTISSEEGVCKPDIEIYQLVQDKIQATPQQILFVDDTETNLHTAASIGWNTLFADSDGQWIAAIDSNM